MDKRDIEKIRLAFEQIKASSKLIITTQKDAVKLNAFKSFFEEHFDLPLYIQPVKPRLLVKWKAKQFSTLIFNYVSKYYSEVETTAND